MTTTKQYRYWCSTELTWVYENNTSVPSVCINNSNHVIILDSIVILSESGTGQIAGPPGQPGAKGDPGPPGDFNWRGTWSSIISYIANDVVQYSGSSYVAVGSGTILNKLPSSSSEWQLVASAGQTGPSGDLVWAGIWSQNTTYNINQVVSYNGTTYIAVATSTNRIPVSSPTFWDLFGGSGESNTAINIGTSTNSGEILKRKIGTEFEFRRLNAVSNKISVTTDNIADTVAFDIVPANIDHQTLLGTGTKTHSQIDAHITSVGNPHNISLDQIKITSAVGDLIIDNGIGSAVLPVGSTGQVLRADSTLLNSGMAWSVLSHLDLADTGTNTHAQLDSHLADVSSNPHDVTLDQIAPSSVKGDIIVFNGTSNVAISSGLTNQVLKVDPTTTTGLKWADDVAGGEINYGTNVGSVGIGLYKGKNGVNLEFKNIEANSTKILVSDNTSLDTVSLDVNEAVIDHNGLLNWTIAEHRTIDDTTTTSLTNLWSSSKINTELTTRVPFYETDLINIETGLGTTGHIKFKITKNEPGLDPYNLGVSADPVKALLTTEGTANNQGAIVFGNNTGATNNSTIYGVSCSTNGGTSWNPALVIKDNGTVGINTNSPNNGVALDVNGNVAVSGLVDGRDISLDHISYDSHLANTSNPHGITIESLAPVTTKGSLMVANGSGTIVALDAGTNSQILAVSNTSSSGLAWIDNTWSTATNIKTWIFHDQRCSGTNGGPASEYWNKRVLNTTVYSDGSEVSLNTVTFVITFEPGKYRIEASAPAYKVKEHKIRFVELSQSGHRTSKHSIDPVPTDVIWGSSEYTKKDAQTRSFLDGIIVVQPNTTAQYILQHWCDEDDKKKYSYGIRTGASGAPEIYSMVTVTKI